MKKFALFLIYIVFLVAFFGNLFVDYLSIPPLFTLLTEASVYSLFVLSLLVRQGLGSRYRWDLWFVFGPFILIAICSALANHLSPLRLIVSLRLVLRFYLFYLALINLSLGERDIRKVNNLLLFIFLCQLPACAIRFYYHGISELTIGTYASHGGGLTPIIPVVAIAYLVGLFAFFKRRYLYIIIAVAFVLYGIAGEKRVLFILYPAVFSLMYTILWIEKRGLTFGFFAGWAIIIAISVGTSAVMLSAIKTLNPEHKQWGSVDFGYALEYAMKYSTARHGNVGSGRIGTTCVAFEYLSKGGVTKMLLGYGPGSLTASILDRRRYLDRRISGLAKSYGLNGMSYTAVEYGLLGLFCIGILFLVFILRARKWFKIERSAYWKAFSFGTYIFAIYMSCMFFAYNRTAIMGDTITPVMYYAMALSYIRLKSLESSK